MRKEEEEQDRKNKGKEKLEESPLPSLELIPFTELSLNTWILKKK